jgi:hypothetical protein
MVSLVVVRELRIAVAGLPELRRRGWPRRRALRRRRRLSVRPLSSRARALHPSVFPVVNGAPQRQNHFASATPPLTAAVSPPPPRRVCASWTARSRSNGSGQF